MPEEKPFEDWALIMLPRNRVGFGLVSEVEIAGEKYLRVYNPEPMPELTTIEFFCPEEVSRIKIVDRETVHILSRFQRQMPLSDSEQRKWQQCLLEFTF